MENDMAKHVASTEDEWTQSLVVKLEGKRPLGRSRPRWGTIFK
jgi:hypothetical protein